MTAYSLTHLRQLEAESIHIIREVAAEFDNPVMLYSIGKDSAVMVRLAEKAFYPAKPPFPLMHVDTTWKFQEMYQLRDNYIAKELGFKLIVHVNEEGRAQGVNPFTHGSKVHTDIMKTQALRQALDTHRFDAAFGGARRDEDGFYWITGRVDDVVIVSGHNIGTAEVESAVVLNSNVAEAACVGIDHPIKGQALYVFVWLNSDAPEPTAGFETELKGLVRSKVGAFAAPDKFHYAPTGLPKTRSGKIMRRILRKVATLGADVTAADLGDTSTLADPGVVDDLIATHETTLTTAK